MVSDSHHEKVTNIAQEATSDNGGEQGGNSDKRVQAYIFSYAEAPAYNCFLQDRNGLFSALIGKSTVSEKSLLHLAQIVIDEIRIQGSRCGPFAPAMHALSQRTVDVHPLISASYTLDDGLVAFEHAGRPGVLKVLVQM